MAETYAVVLAAGQGTRMKSKTHKVLHPICGKPMIRHATDSLKQTGVGRIVLVVGAYADQIKQEMGNEVEYVFQEQQLGTGHAVMQTRGLLGDLEGNTLICYGDTPLVKPETYKALLAEHQAAGAAVTMLTAVVDEPFGLGRILRDDQGHVLGIVEEKDATAEQKAIREINPGLYCFSNSVLYTALEKITNHNSQGEYYLTDCIQIVKQMGLPVKAVQVANPNEVLGVNDRAQLAALNKIMREQINLALMKNGVTLIDPDTAYIDVEVSIGEDTVVGPGVTITGRTVIGKSCMIEAGSQIHSCMLGDEVSVVSSVLKESSIGNGVSIGPFAYIRPGCQVGEGVKVGDFVELKNSNIGSGTKIPHLAYIGDADIGKNTNMGCGVITVNYDSVRKHRTIVGNDSFVGSNSNLIAPVKIGDGAYIATGSTITNEVPDGAFAIARERQVTKEKYADKLKARLRGDKP